MPGLFWQSQANLPDEAISEYTKLLQTGVHFGYARVVLGPEAGESDKVLPMVMSLGWNPYYKNEKRTAVSPAIDAFHNHHLCRVRMELNQGLYSTLL